jgi:hypothetical protein
MTNYSQPHIPSWVDEGSELWAYMADMMERRTEPTRWNRVNPNGIQFCEHTALKNHVLWGHRRWWDGPQGMEVHLVQVLASFSCQGGGGYICKRMADGKIVQYQSVFTNEEITSVPWEYKQGDQYTIVCGKVPTHLRRAK